MEIQGIKLGSMTLHRALNTPDGRAGRIVRVKLDTSAVVRVLQATPECS